MQRELGGLRGRVEEQYDTIGRLADPDQRFAELQRMALEPSFQAIIGGKLTAAQIRRLRAYKLTDTTIAKLVSSGILPEGWPDPGRFFGPAAFRKHLPKAQQLPMEKLQRQLLEGEVAYPENWPERGEDYSRIQPTEWQMLEESERTRVHAANDRIQSSLGELKDLLFMAAALADSDACPDPEERIDTALQFARIQAQFIFDDIAQAERVKMDVATTNLSGGINIGAADATAPDVLGNAQRERIMRPGSLIPQDAGPEGSS
eukprot:COSAG01_NODE_13221_length_1617_cov_6.995389_2_plen_261_part_00